RAARRSAASSAGCSVAAVPTPARSIRARWRRRRCPRLATGRNRTACHSARRSPFGHRHGVNLQACGWQDVGVAGMRRYRRLVLIDRVIPFLAALVGLVALAGAVMVQVNADTKTRAIATAVAELRSSIDALAAQPAAAPTPAD